MSTIAVLLSTYNGEKFLVKQIESILKQKQVEVHLFIRDDGSSDDTVIHIKRLMVSNSNISLYEGVNIGYANSFTWLLNNCPLPSEDCYFAFADQDDVWLPKKLIEAVKKIQTINEHTPVLYYSDLMVVDSNERFIRLANDWEGNIDKYKILTFIGIRGCTMVFNHELGRIIREASISDVPSHDTFIALVAFWTGKVVYDPNPYIHYRQTGQNVSVTGVSRIDKLKKNLWYVYFRMTKKAHHRQKSAKALLKFSKYIENDEPIEKLVYYNKSTMSKLRLLLDGRYFQHSISINITNALLILAGKF